MLWESWIYLEIPRFLSDQTPFPDVAILEPFSAHFKLIFGSFLCIWQSNKQKGIKNDVKNGYHEHPGKEILEKWGKNAFFPSGTLPKRWTMIIFQVYFCKSEVRVPFCINFSFILSFNFEKMETKWNGKWLKNDWKMDQKCQLWTTLIFIKWPGGKNNHYSV